MSAAAAGAAAVRRTLDVAEEYRETPEEVVARLAKLPLLEYDQVREEEAATLGVRVTTLDVEVAKARPQPVSGKSDAKQGHAVVFDEPKPWPEPVNGADLLNALATAIRNFVVMTDEAATAVALWVVHTWLLVQFMISPRLAITSPEKRCGKTTLLDVLERLVKKPRNAANITASVVFRVVEAHQPTLLIDEADTYLVGDEGLRGILNAGHRRGGTVLRSVGDDFEPRAFAVHCAAAIALIGDLPGTVADRSVPIRLQRRRKDEQVEKFRIGRTGQLDVLSRKIARWTADNAIAIGAVDPAMPAGMQDRAEDNFSPLLAIADAAGGEWPEKARQAAISLAREDDDDTSRGVMLLADIRSILAERDIDRMSSEDLADALCKREGRPWLEARNGKPLTANGLARLLKPFKTIPTGKAIRIDEKTPRGYFREWFADAFARYLPPETPSQSATLQQLNESAVSGEIQSATPPADVALEMGRKPAENLNCCSVADESGEAPAEGEV
jgi:putative DNA primase/helicase